MTMNRRTFMHLATASAAAGLIGQPLASRAAPARRYQAVAFDAFPVFDPRPIFKLADTLFPGKGAELGNAWRTRQFEYQWLRALGGQYADFWRATEDALVFAAKGAQLDLTADKRDQLMQAYLQLNAWPDALPALRTLKESGVRLVFLSNMTRAMLETNIRHAGLDGLFEQVLSTDQIRSYKPDPKAYELGVKSLGLKREHIAFAAFAGWDVAGAKWYGYPTFWVNRLKSQPEALGAAADGMGSGLDELVRFVSPPEGLA
ncbi:haloacid dehalogenase type II [Betaproteobacteria bacterium SCN1]|nr:haloacid dehalogenase type II [Betaproteobacteria bacterium SCN1]MBN8760292.1 haloacid dehalogenase type II [Thiobacillus sp.]ODU90026.1 MAG: haloacid dehalogenase, type II [Thiobacillus sp. SCN 65-179]OJW39652.1 MAG: haloacid dehalogenase, type II [Thiobacillus sp. 65-69]